MLLVLMVLQVVFNVLLHVASSSLPAVTARKALLSAFSHKATTTATTTATAACFASCELKEVLGRQMFIKRDDMHAIDATMADITGNKSRKLYSLSQAHPFPELVLSAGGAQSNAMRSIAQLCHHKGSRFLYFTRPLPHLLLQKPIGNLRHALSLGMKVSYFKFEIFIYMPFVFLVSSFTYYIHITTIYVGTGCEQ